MPVFRISIDGHEIEIRASYWSGRESVLLDGVEVSRKSSRQFVSAHGFIIQTRSGDRVVFEANIFSGFRFGFALRRNGILAAASPRNQLSEKEFGPDAVDPDWNGPHQTS